MNSFGLQTVSGGSAGAELKSLILPTDANGYIQDNRLIGKTFTAIDRGGLLINNGIGTEINYATGTITTNAPGIRNIEIIYF